MSNGLDLDAVPQVAEAQEQGVVVHIEDENDKPLYHGHGDQQKPVTITMAGVYSATYRRIERRQRARKLKGGLTRQQLADDEMEKIVACTLAWDGIVASGTPVALNPQNAEALYTKCPWVLDQVAEEMNDARNFSRNSSAS